MRSHEILLLSSVLAMQACVPFTPQSTGGTNLNPCHADSAPWQNRGYCGAASLNVASAVRQSLKQRLHLSSLVNGQLSFDSGIIPLQAQAFLNQNLPEGAYVEFYADGVLVGSGFPDVLGQIKIIDPSFSLLWKNKTLAQGLHDFHAVLKDKDGKVLAESNTVKLNLEKASPLSPEANAIDLLGPAGHISVPSNSRLTLTSLAHLAESLKTDGGRVVFTLRDENGSIVRTLDASDLDGAFGSVLDTTGLPPGKYTLQSQIVDKSGKLITDSNTIDLNIGNPNSKSTINLDLLGPEDSVLPNTNVPLNATIDLSKSDLKKAKTVKFYAEGPDGSRRLVGEGAISGDGHYSIDWDTTGYAPGTYNLISQVFDNAGQLMASSNVDQVTIIGSTAPTGSNAIGLLNIPSTVLPGANVKLTGAPTISPELAKQGVKVKFEITKPDGSLLTVPGIKQPNGTYIADLSTTGLPEGQYKVKSILLSLTGKVLSSSQTKAFTLGQSKIELSPPVASTFPGDTVKLSSIPTVSETQSAQGVSVSFEVRDEQGNLIATLQGIKQADGSFSADWFTGGLSTRLYNITSILKDSQGNVLDTSNVGQTRLVSEAANRLDLTSGNLSIQSPGGSGLLTTKPTIAPGINPNDVKVEFVIQGPVGPVIIPGVRQSDGSYTADFSGSQLPLGEYPYNAVLKDNTGKILAESTPGEIVLSAVAQDTIELTASTQNITANIGSKVKLAAQVILTSTQVQAGHMVEFYIDGKKVGTGVKQPDGSYSTEFDTSNSALGQHPIEAVLKSPAGTELDRSNLGQLILTQALTNNNTVTLTPPLSSGSAAVGSTLTLQAKVSLDPNISHEDVIVEFKDENGNVVATGSVDKNGNVSATWVNAGPIGDHTLTAELKQRNGGTTLASSSTEPAKLYEPNPSSGGGGGGGGGSTVTINLGDPALTTFPGEKVIPLSGNIGSLPSGFIIGQNFTPTVEIFSNGTSIGQATVSPDGSYILDWNTTGSALGSAILTAKLTDNINNPTSNIGTVKFISDVLSVDTELPQAGNPTFLRQPNQTFKSNIPGGITSEQVTNGATVFFEVLDNGGNLALAPILASQITAAGADQDKWQTTTADFTTLLADSNYTVRAVARSNNASYGTIGSTPPANSTYLAVDATPVPINTNTPAVALTGTPADDSIIPSATANVALTGTAANIPVNHTVQFLIKASGTNTIVDGPLTATDAGGGNYTGTWATAGETSNQDYDIEIRIAPNTDLNSGTSELIKDSRDVEFMSPSNVITKAKVTNTGIGPAAAATITSPAITPDQDTQGDLVFFEIRSETNVLLNTVPGVKQGNGTWVANWTSPKDITNGDVTFTSTPLLRKSDGTTLEATGPAQNFTVNRCAIDPDITRLGNHSFEIFNTADTVQSGGWGRYLNPFACWSVTSSTPTNVIEVNTHPGAPDGSFSTDMNADNASDFYQDVPTTIGKTYTLVLAKDANGGGTKQTEVTWNGVVITTLSYNQATDASWLPQTINLPAATGTTSRLEFRSLVGGSGGMLLDNMLLTED